MRKHCRRDAALAAPAWLATTVPLLACCMVPRTYPGAIGQSEQEAVLIHDNGREELILYVLTRKERDYESSSDSLKRIRWEREEDRIQNVPVQPERVPKTLRAAFAKNAFKGD